MDTAIYKVLVLGLGNTLMSDDGVGVYVTEALNEMRWPPGVLILEAGASILSCLGAISLSRTVIAVDAVRAGGNPGSIYRCEVVSDLTPDNTGDAHGVSLPGAVKIARAMTGCPGNLIVYGAEPHSLCLGSSLSPAVKKALPGLLAIIAGEILEIYIN